MATLSVLPFPHFRAPKAIPAEMGASWQRRFGSCQLYPRPGQGECTAFEIEDRKPVVRAASLHPEPDVKTTIDSTVSFEPISFNIAIVLT